MGLVGIIQAFGYRYNHGETRQMDTVRQIDTDGVNNLPAPGNAGPKRRMDLKWSMVTLLLLCWLIPIIIISFVTLFMITGKLNSQVSNTVVTSANKAVQNIDMQLEECINASRNASYFQTISDSYQEYLQTQEQQALYDSMTLYLAQQYRYIRNANSTIVFFTQNPELLYSTYSTGYKYDSILEFKKYGITAALDVSKQLDTAIWFYDCNGLIYMMRNIMDENYHPYAMIVMELNMDYMVDSLESVWGYDACGVYLNANLIYGESMNIPEGLSLVTKTDSAGIYKADGTYYVYFTEKQEKQYLSYVIRLNSDILLGETKAAYYIEVILLLSMIPLCVIVFIFFAARVSKPVESLVTAAEQITGGNYGYHIAEPGNSSEFMYLNASFNEMSDELKHQFEQIYLEEIALRDADFKALQSQINPHFLNNTLEVINWEARMNGDERVSSMIEALATMLNATLNRRAVETIPLSEELEYVNAYLYIISERMGSKLSVVKEVDEELLKTEVPRLIIQPIIENAIEHGVKIAGRGEVRLNIYSADDYMYIDVHNSGNMTAEDEQRVKELLGGEPGEGKLKSTSLGIRNVNKRLKLMYGEDSGLMIVNDGEGTLNRLRFRMVRSAEAELS